MGQGGCGLDEEQFLDEADAALAELLRDYFDKVLQLQVKHFNLQLPAPRDQQHRTQSGWR